MTPQQASGEEQRSDVAYAAKIVHKSSLRFA
jgi:hypothetical protein